MDRTQAELDVYGAERSTAFALDADDIFAAFPSIRTAHTTYNICFARKMHPFIVIAAGTMRRVAVNFCAVLCLYRAEVIKIK